MSTLYSNNTSCKLRRAHHMPALAQIWNFSQPAACGVQMHATFVGDGEAVKTRENTRQEFSDAEVASRTVPRRRGGVRGARAPGVARGAARARIVRAIDARAVGRGAAARPTLGGCARRRRSARLGSGRCSSSARGGSDGLGPAVPGGEIGHGRREARRRRPVRRAHRTLMSPPRQRRLPTHERARAHAHAHPLARARASQRARLSAVAAPPSRSQDRHPVQGPAGVVGPGLR